MSFCRSITFSQKLSNLRNIIRVNQRRGIRQATGWKKKDDPPGEDDKCFTEIIAELNVKDPELDQDINIGFPLERNFVSKTRRKDWAKVRTEREQQARLGKLNLDLQNVRANWFQESGRSDVKTIAEHYGIFRDLFDNAFFYPKLDIEITYDFDEEYVTPVYRGNRLSPSESSTQPEVFYKSDDGELWTLLLTAPDSHLQDNQQEYLLWFVGNIPGCDIAAGDTVHEYLPPFPAMGTGLHRYVFILYKQNGKMDYSRLKEKHKNPLVERTFTNVDFYRQHQDDLTAASVAFFQSEWDPTVTDIYRETLGMPEPRFEFMHPPPYHSEQVAFPAGKPFNLYLDRYRDKKDIAEEVLKEKLKTSHPLKPPEKELKYPNIFYDEDSPSWLKTKTENKQLKRFQWKALDD